MPITWRSVTQANQGAANQLAVQGANTITDGLGSLAGILTAPKAQEQAAAQQELENQIRVAGLDQGQQRIDNSVDQFDQNLAFQQEGRELSSEQQAEKLAADLTNTQAAHNNAIERLGIQNANASGRDAENRAHALELEKIRAGVDLKQAQIRATANLEKAKLKEQNDGKPVNLQKYTDNRIELAPDMSNEHKLLMKSYASHIEGIEGLPREAREALINDVYQDGFFADREKLTGIPGILGFGILGLGFGTENSPKDFDTRINAFREENPQLFHTPLEAGNAARSLTGNATTTEAQKAARKAAGFE